MDMQLLVPLQDIVHIHSSKSHKQICGLEKLVESFKHPMDSSIMTNSCNTLANVFDREWQPPLSVRNKQHF